MDMRTIIVSYVISNVVCAAVVAFLWVQNRKHFAGIGLWLADFVMQVATIMLISLRGVVPDFMSIVVSNTLLIGGTILLYAGLERFVGKRGPQIHNAIFLTAFILVHIYFAFVQPSLEMRDINISLGLVIVCTQIAWLMLRRVDAELRPITRGVGIVMVIFSLISAARIGVEVAVPPSNDFFQSNIFETTTIQTYQMAFIILTFSLFLMVNRRLVADLERDIIERKRAEEIVRLRLRLWEYAATHTVDELMQKALDEIGELTGSPIGFYHFVEEDQNTLSLRAWSTRTLQEFCRAEGKGMHYPIEDAGVWADAVRQRKPSIHNDYATLPDRKGMPDGHAEVIREMVVPVIRGDRVVSALGVGNKPFDYTEKDVELVAYVADIVWIIVERKRAEEDLHRTNAELQARNEELDAFGHTVAHDLKNPLSNIIGSAYLLADRDRPPSAQEANQLSRTITQMSLKMDSIIEELMLLAGLRKTEVKMEPLDMAQIVAETLARLAYLIEESRAEIVYPASWPEVVGYKPWVEEVWVNYIANAIKYGGHPPHIELGATPDGDHISFWIHDNGLGLTSEEQARLFAPFERLEQRRLTGHGLGLSIVRRIMERMGGQVSVKSSGLPGEGSTFGFTLPASDRH